MPAEGCRVPCDEGGIANTRQCAVDAMQGCSRAGRVVPCARCLRREGWRVNAKPICPLYAEEGLQLRYETPKHRVAARLREHRSPPAAPNEVWATDFLSNQLFHGRCIRILTIVDAFSRLSPAIDVRPQYRGTDVVETLVRVTAIHRTPQTIRLDNGPEFVSQAPDLWAWLNGVTLDLSRPGKPTDNAFIASCNGSFRAECLNTSWFLGLADGRSPCEVRQSDCNPFAHTARSAKTPRSGWQIHRSGMPPLRWISRDFVAPGGPALGACATTPMAFHSGGPIQGRVGPVGGVPFRKPVKWVSLGDMALACQCRWVVRTIERVSEFPRIWFRETDGLLRFRRWISKLGLRA